MNFEIWPVDGRRRSDHISKDHFLGKMFDEQGSPRMYANILLSTDGSDVARTGVEHGIALAKPLNAKVTVITVTEALPIDYGSGHAGGWIPSQEEFDRFDAACSLGRVKTALWMSVVTTRTRAWLRRRSQRSAA